MNPFLLGLRAVVAAFSFLTVLPFGRLVALDGRDVARGSVLFPAVGAAIGALTGSAAWLLGDQLPPMLAAALAVAVGAAVTGALHLDGLADCADGFGARTPEDRLRVMRDHTNGTYGGTALVLDLLIRVGVLAALAGTREALVFSVVAGALSRTAGPLLAVALPYAQDRPGAGEALSSHPSQPRAAAALVVGGSIAFACIAPDSAAYAAALVAAAVVTTLVGWTSRRRLGGVTGDVMGAASELVELAVLVALVWVA
ncbi:MAG: adenosylcobinamide-GDP ribazoletransferase [Propionibacteriales bacterium]|nr:adenosylcobinamide-GDP ribazoletransferase [Propionibacteriales bacterium]